jgi:hypothetical protein
MAPVLRRRPVTSTANSEIRIAARRMDVASEQI